MTERTLRDRISALLVHPTRDQDDMIYNLAIGDALAALDAHTAEQPAPDAVAEAGRSLLRIVEEIEGAMKHGTWRDEKGGRLKDTPEWVSFYNAAKGHQP